MKTEWNNQLFWKLPTAMIIILRSIYIYIYNLFITYTDMFVSILKNKQCTAYMFPCFTATVYITKVDSMHGVISVRLYLSIMICLYVEGQHYCFGRDNIILVASLGQHSLYINCHNLLYKPLYFPHKNTYMKLRKWSIVTFYWEFVHGKFHRMDIFLYWDKYYFCFQPYRRNIYCLSSIFRQVIIEHNINQQTVHILHHHNNMEKMKLNIMTCIWWYRFVLSHFNFWFTYSFSFIFTPSYIYIYIYIYIYNLLGQNRYNILMHFSYS